MLFGFEGALYRPTIVVGIWQFYNQILVAI